MPNETTDVYKWRMNEWMNGMKNNRYKNQNGNKICSRTSALPKTHRKKNAINSTDCSVTISQNSTSDNAISRTSTISQWMNLTTLHEKAKSQF